MNNRGMKDSGVEWIGEIPENWKVGRVKHAFIRKNSKANQENPVVLSLTRDGVKVRDISKNEGQLAENYSNYNPVDVGDFLLNPMDLYSGANCNVSKVSGVISPAYINLKSKTGFNANFFDYYFKTQYWTRALFAHGKGVSFDYRWTLNNDTLQKYYMPLPPLHEQQAIATYLDEKVSNLDQLIEEQQRVIEEWKAYKQSLITETVTKGLNPEVELKESGVEWIGEIPSHWEVKKLKFLSSIKTGNKDTQNKDDSGVYPFFVRSDNVERINSFTFDGEAVLTAGDGVGVGKVFHYINGKFDYHQRVYNFHNFRGVIGKFFYYFLKELFIKEIEKGTAKTTVDSLRLPLIKEFPISIPPLHEQQMIADFLDEKCSKIDQLIEDKQRLIEDLKAYKQSLIYECVTGKKEIV